MTHGPRFARTLVLGFTIGMLSLLPVVAFASEDGWAHRSSQTTAPDGWTVRTQHAPLVDGWAVRSSDRPRTAGIKDGFQVSLVELPQPEAIRDGWEVASVELPRPEAIRDGWEVASVELPRPATVSQAVPAPQRPSVTTTDLIGLALASASAAAILTGMAITFRQHRHHAL